MSRSGVQLKASSGWFAAGVEVHRAAMLLSDAAFKLYVWLCLHAQRDHGCLQASADDIAAALQKTGHDVRACLVELDRAGVCHCGPPNLIHIRDSFWPYARTEPFIRDGRQTEIYVSEVKRLLLAHACVSTAFTPADDRIAAEWYRTGVSLQVIDRAIQLGGLRKYATLINHGSGTPITPPATSAAWSMRSPTATHLPTTGGTLACVSPTWSAAGIDIANSGQWRRNNAALRA